VRAGGDILKEEMPVNKYLERPWLGDTILAAASCACLPCQSALLVDIGHYPRKYFIGDPP